jgi:hypothetical protein
VVSLEGAYFMSPLWRLEFYVAATLMEKFGHFSRRHEGLFQFFMHYNTYDATISPLQTSQQKILNLKLRITYAVGKLFS